MKYFNVYEEIYINDERIGKEWHGNVMREEAREFSESFSGAEIIKEIKHLSFSKRFHSLGFTVFKAVFCKKYIISISDYFVTWRISRELHRDDIITYKVIEEETIPSIREVYNYSNGEKAIQWLTERGANISPN